MKHWLPLIAILVLSVAIFGCGDGGNDQATTTAQHDHGDGQPHSHDDGNDHAPSGAMSGTVTETMDSGGYTYIHVDCGDGEMIWAAAPRREAAVGDAVTISTGMPMKNFHSDTLDRTFDVVYFTNGFGGSTSTEHPSGMGGQMGGQMGNDHPTAEPAGEIDLSGIERAAGGKTVAEVWGERTALAGQEVVVSGRVVKYLSGIMGTNWIHLRDGSGSDGTNDLTVTTDGFAAVGDLVTVTGKISVDRDFGAGYRYEVIMEDAKVAKQ